MQRGIGIHRRASTTPTPSPSARIVPEQHRRRTALSR